ncbi:hypothetical protein [Polaromonas sp.]|uniref:hypothetical protein n=1 Tax=Polaromonas sp. TaxID=1869339 RepID=UPI00326452FD
MRTRIPWLYRLATLVAATACAAFILAGRIGEGISAYYFPREHLPVSEKYYWGLAIVTGVLIVETLFAPGYRYLRRKKNTK